MFTDYVLFTAIAEKLTPTELVEDLDYCFSCFDDIIKKYGLEKIKTIGDAYMCVGGVPVPNKTHAIDMVHAGLEIQKFMHDWKTSKIEKGQTPFELRVGIHSGPLTAGVVGKQKFAFDIWGSTVNLASRLEASGERDQVNISGATYELIKSHFICKHRGKIAIKNKGEVDMYFVISAIREKNDALAEHQNNS
jgi:class 3 adenylate cyclase